MSVEEDDIVARLSVGLLTASLSVVHTEDFLLSDTFVTYPTIILMIGPGLVRQDDHAANNVEESQRVGDKMLLPVVVRLSPSVVK
jgi:hypothetical protein